MKLADAVTVVRDQTIPAMRKEGARRDVEVEALCVLLADAELTLAAEAELTGGERRQRERDRAVCPGEGAL